MRTRMNVFIRCAIGAFDWSSVVSQTGQTISASRSAAFGGAASRSPGDDERTEHCEQRDSHHDSASSIAERSWPRSSSPFTAPANARTTRPSRSMTNVSGKPVTP